MEFTEFRAAVLQARAEREGRGQMVRFPAQMPTKSRERHEEMVDKTLTYVGGAIALACYLGVSFRSL